MKSVITCDLEGRIETYNDDAAAIFGWSRDEVVGKKRVSLFSPGEVVLEHVPRWLKLASERGSFETDTVFVKKDGSPFPAHIKISPTRKGERQIGFCGVTEPLPQDELARATPKISTGTRVFRWLVVTRAPFLTATVVPVLAAAALAARTVAVDARFWLAFALALVGACALHVAANTFNDVFDWRSGADQDNNDYFLPFSGGSRALELRLITERGLARLAWAALAVAAACGAALIALGAGPAILVFGVAGAFAAYFYTAPPLRLAARRGLGELFVGLCFGPFITGGVVAALTGVVAAGASTAVPGATLSGAWAPDALAQVLHGLWPALAAGVPLGLLTSAILWINEFPDAASDARAGKNHLVVTLGKPVARAGYIAVVAFAFAVFVVLGARGVVPWAAALAPLVALPLAVRAVRVLFAHLDDRELIVANKSTIQLHAVAGLAYAVALVLA